jgi:hypothetical protein
VNPTTKGRVMIRPFALIARGCHSRLVERHAMLSG